MYFRSKRLLMAKDPLKDAVLRSGATFAVA